MKKKRKIKAGLFSLLVLTVPIIGEAQTLDLGTGTFQDFKTVSLPGREVEYLSDGVKITYTIPEVSESTNPERKDEVVWNIPGFAPYSIEGCPSLPLRNDIISLEGHGRVKVTILEECHVDYKSKIAPSIRPQLASEEVENPRTEISEYSEFFPSTPVCLVKTGEYRGNDINFIRVMPVQYDMQNGIIRAYTRLVYKVSLEDTAEMKKIREVGETGISTPDEFNAFSGFSIPIEKVSEKKSIQMKLAPGQFSEAVISYLIIAPNSLKESAERFAVWKRKMGFNVQVALAEQWSKEAVKNRIKRFYNKNNQAMYVLLLGDTQKIEPYYFDLLLSQYPTDYPYGCLGGDDDWLADIYHSRIPASDLSEANRAIDKIIEYENNPTLDPKHYKKALHLSFFEDGGLDGVSDNMFVSTSENIKRHLEAYEGVNVTRFYTKTNGCQPKHFGKSIGGVFRFDIEDLEGYSNEILLPDFNWNDNVDTGAFIKNAWNTEDYLYILYNSHSYTDRWGNPYFNYNSISDLGKVQNPPFVFSISCQAGKFDEKINMAHRFLTAPGAAVNVIASSPPSWLGYSDMLCEALLNLQFPSTSWDRKFTCSSLTNGVGVDDINYDDLNSKSKYPIAVCLEKSKNYVEQWLSNDDALEKLDSEFPTKLSHPFDQRLGFHNFGDPSIKMRITAPKKIWVSPVQRSGEGTSGKIIVSSVPSSSRVVFYDTVSNKVEVIRSSTPIEYATTRPNKITVVILNEEYAPFVSEAPEQ